MVEVSSADSGTGVRNDSMHDGRRPGLVRCTGGAGEGWCCGWMMCSRAGWMRRASSCMVATTQPVKMRILPAAPVATRNGHMGAVAVAAVEDAAAEEDAAEADAAEDGSACGQLVALEKAANVHLDFGAALMASSRVTPPHSLVQARLSNAPADGRVASRSRIWSQRVAHSCSRRRASIKKTKEKRCSQLSTCD